MITGSFISLDVPQRLPGQVLSVTYTTTALNPGALYWKTYVVADCAALGWRKLIENTNEVGQNGGRTKTVSLFAMPNQDIVISFFFFASDNASDAWDWNEYDYWLQTGDTSKTYLDSAYISLSPGEPPPEAPEFSGLITVITPTKIDPGQPLDIFVTFNAYTESTFQQVNGWWTRVIAKAGSYGDYDAQFHTGRDGSRVKQPLHLGTMPQSNLSGTVTLQAHVGGFFPTEPGEDGEWVTLSTKSFAISYTTTPPPDGDGGDGDTGIGWAKAAPWIIGGILAVLILPELLGGKKSKR